MVRHGAAGTIVTGTDPGDSALREALTANNFTLSAAQDFWYLPHGWEQPTRALAVTRLTRHMANLSRDISVELNDGAHPAVAANSARITVPGGASAEAGSVREVAVGVDL